MTPPTPTFMIAVALAAGILAQSVARRLHLPGIVLLLAFGVGLGPDGLHWVDPHALGEGLFGLIEVAVAVILFEGGLNLEISRLRRQETPILRLITLGALVTLVGGTLAARVLLDWSWSLSALFGSLVVVTGPTVVTPLVRELRLRPELKTVLEAEGVLIDPIGAILAVVALQIVLVPDAFAGELARLLGRLAFGALAGGLGGLLLGGLLRARGLVPHGLANVFTLSAVVLLFVSCDRVLSSSGILAVTVAGVVVGNLNTPVDRDLREFKDQLTVLLVGMIFVLLAASLRLQDVHALGVPGALVVAALVLVVRPLGVWLSTRRSALSIADRLFVGWMGPRGIVAAAIATLTVETLEARGLSGGPELRALVFLTIGATVLLVGLTALPLAVLLRLRLPGRDRVAILGAQGLGIALGKELKTAEVPVVFLDSDPRNTYQAESAGFPVVFGDALAERTMQRAQMDLVGTAIGATPNDYLNSLFVGTARDLFDVPRVAVAVNALPGDKAPDHVERLAGEVLFDGPHDLERWDVRWRHGDTVVETFVFHPPQPSTDAAPDAVASPSPGTTDRFVILLIRRGQRSFPMTLGFEPYGKDRAAVAIYEPEREQALASLALLGWRPEEPPSENRRQGMLSGPPSYDGV